MPDVLKAPATGYISLKVLTSVRASILLAELELPFHARARRSHLPVDTWYHIRYQCIHAHPATSLASTARIFGAGTRQEGRSRLRDGDPDRKRSDKSDRVDAGEAREGAQDRCVGVFPDGTAAPTKKEATMILAKSGTRGVFWKQN